MDWAVLLMAYGGPDSLDDVEPYLLDVRGGRETPPALVEEIRGRYAKIGGRSPLLEITRAQAAALETALNQQSKGMDQYRVFVGMRHWHPYIQETVQEIHAAGIQNLVALCMTPFASRMSTGAYREKLNAALRNVDPQGTIQTRSIDFWYENPAYVQALQALVRDGLSKFPLEARDRVVVVFTAHSLPSAIMELGDPYGDQFNQLAVRIARAAGLPEDRWKACYQSAGAQNGRWLGPSLEEMLEILASAGEKSVLVAPVGFVSDHVEILYDIDIEAREQAERLGIHLERTEAPNTFSPFIESLANIVFTAVRKEAQPHDW
jgi:ferrochelatase